MLKQIPQILGPSELARCRQLLEAGEWSDGNVTSGPQAASAKRNFQVRTDSGAGRDAQALVRAAVSGSAAFLSAALPFKLVPPLFNQYQVGQRFGQHIDNAIRAVRASGELIRTDLSATLFISDPSEYEGGELVIETALGPQEVKLPAGDLVLYPARSIHWVRPITHGVRLASFFWVQSLVRDDSERTLLYDLETAAQIFARLQGPEHPQVARLLHVHQALMRRWTEL